MMVCLLCHTGAHEKSFFNGYDGRALYEQVQFLLLSIMVVQNFL
ncbi:MAG TPA: hypothetical protein DEB17_11330 [Chlorobaculum sp.]|uniref:Uncharacterized protein n=1 Tax=Chlorobaculum tepidum (strain ATCC 49652 / DSM 12025 / NBRC 103806 / TLS) TaxID=194439 RepID=Q8KCQ8_CHLTE|nr:hypothetical protein CT1355 [Chlorobaculum tepidum TLS]HBU24558.1 hypothetical protein [Chlorobaculum sp.]